MGVAPPMAGGPARYPGPIKSARDRMVEAARLLFDAAADAPHLMKELNEVIESLTKVIHQSAEPQGSPPEGFEGEGGPPDLNRTPEPPPGSGALASAVAGGVNPAMMLARAMGR